MSAHDQIRAMLDQLMGSAAGGGGQQQQDEVAMATGGGSSDYSHQSICKAFLLGVCPHEVLTGTRMELGPCTRTHSLALRSDYNRDLENKQDLWKSYVYDAMEILEAFIKESDRRTSLAQKKLDDQNDELTTPELLEKDKLVKSLGEEISLKLGEAEELGSSGRIEDSLSLLQQVEELKIKKANAEVEYKKAIPPAFLQQQKLRVCIVCSSYLGVNDNDRRLADHFGGKLHLGFIKLREGYEELKAKIGEIGARPPQQQQQQQRHHQQQQQGRSHHHSSSTSSSRSYRSSYHGNSSRRNYDDRHHHHNSSSSSRDNSSSGGGRKYYGNKRDRSRSPLQK